MVENEQPKDIDAIETELEEVSENAGGVQDVIEAEDEETKVPISYDNAEEALLSMFVWDADIATLIAQSGLRENHFLKRRNKLLYPVLMDVRLKTGACTYDLVADACEKETLPDGQTLLDEIGGLAELNTLINSTPEAIDLKVAQAYIDIISEQYKLFKIKDALRWVISQKKFDDAKIIEKLSIAQQVLTENLNRYGLTGFDELLIDTYERFKDRKANPEAYEGLKTGFYYMDKFKAFGKKRVCVLGARTNIGKSIIVGNIVTHMITHDTKVLVFTPEMDKAEYVDRMLCAYSGIEIDRWKAATVGDKELDLISTARTSLIEKAARNLFIEDKGSQTCSFILNSIKRHMLNHKVDLVVVDYLQKMKYYGDNTKRAITDTMERFCSFAKDNNISFLIVSQLRRSDNPEPQMNELKESGDIENFADSVILLHRNSTFKMNERNKGWYKIEKNRQGRLSDHVALKFDENCLKFTEAEIPDENEGHDSYFDVADEDRPTEQSVMKTVNELNK